MSLELLNYRRWQGQFLRPAWAVWPIARVSLSMLFRRKTFWMLYAFSLLIFLMFFFGRMLMDWFVSEMPATIRIEGMAIPTERFVRFFRQVSQVLNGTQETFRWFFLYQGLMVMVTLALT